MRTLLCILLLLLPLYAAAQNPITISIQPSTTEIKQGDQLGLTVTLKNTYSPTPPVKIAAVVKFKDAKGNQMPDATGSANIIIVHPVSVQKLALTIPSPLLYVANTAKLDGKTITANMSQGTLTLTLSKDLSEQATATIELMLKMQGTLQNGTTSAGQSSGTSQPNSVTISVN